MTGTDLPDDDNVVRYAKPTTVREDGSVDGSAFRLRPSDKGLSVNWLQYFQGLDKSQQLDMVRQSYRLTMRPNGRLAELNIGSTKLHVHARLKTLRFIHAPLAAEGEYQPDASHAEIRGLPPGDTPEAALIGDMIAECIQTIHPAITRQQT